MEKYVLVQWPDSQMLMDHERFHECLFVQDIEGHDEVGSAAYMCPIDLYDEVMDIQKKKDQEIIDALKSISKAEMISLLTDICRGKDNANEGEE